LVERSNEELEMGINKREDFVFISDPAAIDEVKWTKFVIENPYGNIFHLPEMFKLFSNQPGQEPVLFAVLNKSDELLGLAVGTIQSSNTKILKPFTARCIFWGSPLLKDDSTELADFIISNLTKFLSQRVIYIQFRNMRVMDGQAGSYAKNFYTKEDHLDIEFNLKNSEEYLWGQIHPTRRKQIKRSLNRGVSVESHINLDGNSIAQCYEMLQLTYRSVGLPLHGKDFFVKALDDLSAKRRIRIFLAKFKEEIIGFRFVLLFNGLIYDWYASSKNGFKDKYPNDLLPWEVIRWGIQNGFSCFDFGGAGNPNIKYGVRDFKLKFGGEVVNYGRFLKVNKPFKMLLGKLVFKLMKFLKV
jgi:serine/alanine adding enzyme